MDAFEMQFLGTGNAMAVDLGESSAVLLRNGRPMLLIDCGPQVPSRYREQFGGPPPALYITHTHLDHVGGLERLFVEQWFDPYRRGRLPVLVPVTVLPLLHMRVADHPNALAEGGTNFWEAFRLVPVSRGFWLDGVWFDIFPVRHHAVGAAYGLALRGSFVYTGDTRPIPEMLRHYAADGETVFHDCALQGNPSHTGLEDLAREYPDELRRQLVLYHYGDGAEAQALRHAGYRVAALGVRIPLPSPLPQSPESVVRRTPA